MTQPLKEKKIFTLRLLFFFQLFSFFFFGLTKPPTIHKTKSPHPVSPLLSRQVLIISFPCLFVCLLLIVAFLYIRTLTTFIFCTDILSFYGFSKFFLKKTGMPVCGRSLAPQDVWALHVSEHLPRHIENLLVVEPESCFHSLRQFFLRHFIQTRYKIKKENLTEQIIFFIESCLFRVLNFNVECFSKNSFKLTLKRSEILELTF